jgi:hypothetical protein
MVTSKSQLETNASGIGIIIDEGNSTKFSIEFNSINNTTVSHIHKGMAGKNGPHVFTPFSILDPFKQQGGLVIKGSIHEEFGGPFYGNSMEDSTELMISVSAYINTHNEDYPKELIRVQIVLEG